VRWANQGSRAGNKEEGKAVAGVLGRVYTAGRICGRRWRNAVAEEEEDLGVETSFEELAKRAEDVEEEDDDDSVLDLGRGDDKTEALVEKVIPLRANEFTCRNCFLVKHRSQLADKKKMLCRDCA
jgi:hypothetical protein